MKYQLHCPKCHYEFTYDNDYYDKNIARLGAEIKNIMVQMAEYKRLSSSERKKRLAWYNRAKQILIEKQEEIGGLKAIRKVADQQINQAAFQLFKNIIKERFGEAVYKEILDKTKEELEAYKVSGLMWHEYTKASGKSTVTKVEKLR